MESANDIMKIHDWCLEYEMEILSAVEALADRRIAATNSRSIADFKNIVPLLDVVIENAEIYKGYLEEDI